MFKSKAPVYFAKTIAKELLTDSKYSSGGNVIRAAGAFVFPKGSPAYSGGNKFITTNPETFTYFHPGNTSEYFKRMALDINNHPNRGIYHTQNPTLPDRFAYNNQKMNLNSAMNFSQYNTDSTKDYLNKLQGSAFLDPNYFIHTASETKELISDVTKQLNLKITNEAIEATK